jgi:hypothetical protein
MGRVLKRSQVGSVLPVPGIERLYIWDDIKRRPKRRRKRVRPKAVVVPMRRISKKDLQKGREDFPEAQNLRRPKNRSECVDGPRPCPWVGCPYHLWLEVHPHTGTITYIHPDVDPVDMPLSCVLDVAEHGPHRLEMIGILLNVSRERVRQIESSALRKLSGIRSTRKQQAEMRTLKEYHNE